MDRVAKIKKYSKKDKYIAEIAVNSKKIAIFALQNALKNREVVEVSIAIG